MPWQLGICGGGGGRSCGGGCGRGVPKERTLPVVTLCTFSKPFTPLLTKLYCKSHCMSSARGIIY
jgi:hypothetical protein